MIIARHRTASLCVSLVLAMAADAPAFAQAGAFRQISFETKA